VRPNGVIVLIFAGVFGLGIGGWVGLETAGVIGASLPAPGGIVCAGVLFLGVTLCHLINYTGLEDESPTATMVRFVDLGEPNGRSADELERLIPEDEGVAGRLDVLVRDGMVEREGDRYRLTRRGRVMTFVLTFWVKILGVPRGG
jgi:hypothetical protein